MLSRASGLQKLIRHIEQRYHVVILLTTSAYGTYFQSIIQQCHVVMLPPTSGFLNFSQQ